MAVSEVGELMDIKKYKPVIDDILRKLRVARETRDDMSQECYLELWGKKEVLAGATDEMALAAVICRNHVLETIRDQNRHHVEGDSLDDPIVRSKASKLAALDPNFDGETMSEALKGLPTEEFDVISRLYVEGYSRAETAASLGIHPHTVDNRAKSGVALLKKYFGEE